ncbi:hypothetical protein BU23DRAFT_591333 [Bimuria novae-zelandiae CBS 107.79]|uniref:DUF3176 domain containing protein n=1 Tax=Bimuria novae-zelandiae CBS 107.79 TaxID=1447943 RepID=A0A6A5V051_9PLEO|nr:hypothetical protein BU23DRAFT_591333 [Bimuria novae-zelandiae CBS 107.79]
MSKLPISPFCSRNPQIPIYLDTGNEREQICPNCDLNSRDYPIHCITTASPAPPSYRSAASPAISLTSLAPPTYDASASPAASSRNLTVPTLRLETPRRWYRPQAPRPALRFDVQSNAHSRPRVRARRVTFSPLSPVTTIHDDEPGRRSYTSGSSIPNTPVDDIGSTTKGNLGLGIPEAPFNPNPSLIRSPGSERLASAEKGQHIRKSSTPNLAEGIEQKLWKYSASSNVVKRWLLEIISWLVSALCMSAIIILLFFLQNKPMPNHWPMNITLNAYIAIISRVSSASLMLPVSEAIGQLKWSWFQGRSKKMWDFELSDNASRGPWGMTLAALGAAITIFVMAMDPFFQQVVRYPQRTVLQLQNSSIPRVTRYEPHYTKKWQSGALVLNPDRDRSAIADKFFFDMGVPQVQAGNGTRAEVPLYCPTSDCKWEPYDTLGVCSECEDVVDMLDFGCLPAKLDWVQNATSFTPYENGTISRKPLFGGSINFKHIRNPINNFVVVSTADGPDQDSILKSIFQHQKPRALECVLSWCVKTIESSYHDATYTEIVKDRFINTTTGPFPWQVIPVDPSDPNAGSNIYYPQGITVDPHAFNGQGNVSSYGDFNDTAIEIVTIFDDYLPSFATLANNVSERLLKYQTWQEVPYIREYPINPWTAPNNITHHMERLAKVMTNTIRQSSDDAAIGKSFSTETYIGVRWVWLSLPLALLVLALIFLAGTVIRTSMENDRVGRPPSRLSCDGPTSSDWSLRLSFDSS